MFDIPCVIFAGGKSSRMGQDKALLPFGGLPSLTQFQYNRLSKLFTSVYISSKDTDKFDFQASFIEDSKESLSYAPTAGFVAAFASIEEERIFIISVDTPFVDEACIKRLIVEDTITSDATVARSPEGLHPMCGIYHRSLESQFIKMQKDDNHKLGMLLKQNSTHEVLFDSDLPFSNLNHPHEYEAALKKI